MTAMIQGRADLVLGTIMKYLAKLLILFKLLLVCLCGFEAIASELAADPPTVEQRYAVIQEAMTQFRERVSLRDRQRMKRVAWKQRFQLPPRLREPYETWYGLTQQEEMWRAAKELKQALLALQGIEEQKQPAVQAEADRISQEVIGVFERKGKEWNMLSSALMNNVLINMKVRKNGFCWHWVEAFMEVLYPIQLEYYRLNWGVAHLGTSRENNSLVITARDQAFEDGLMIDAWRSSGRPFWRITKQDRFPWIERTDLKVTYCGGSVCTVATDKWADPDR